MADECQAPSSATEDADGDTEEVVPMEISQLKGTEENMEIKYDILEVKELKIASPDQSESEVSIPMDEEGIYVTRDRIMQDLFRSVAVWSCDSRSDAIDIIPLVTRFGDIEDLKDHWTGKRLFRWAGIVVIFRNCSCAIKAAQDLPEMKINGKWPLKAINIGLWLDKIYAIELALNETELKYHATLVCVSNVNDALSVEEVRPSCEIFGPVLEISPIVTDEQNVTYFMIKYVYSADAYTAKWYMNGKGSGERKIEVSILMSPKIEAIEKEISKSDLIIWNKS